MAAVLDALKAQVQANVDAEAAAVQALNGVADRIQTAVTKALANGASESELLPVQDEVNALKASAADLGAAVVANTPAA